MWRIARAKRYENREGAEDIVALAACEHVGTPAAIDDVGSVVANACIVQDAVTLQVGVKFRAPGSQSLSARMRVECDVLGFKIRKLVGAPLRPRQSAARPPQRGIGVVSRGAWFGQIELSLTR
jgi:hypothetical protein